MRRSSCPTRLVLSISRHVTGASGGAMIGAIVAILMAGVLGAGAASMLSTSALHEVRANHGERAYYLAESGFRYAVSTFRSNGSAALQALDNQVVTAGGGSFTLGVTINNGNQTFAVNGPQTGLQPGGNLAIRNVSGALQPRNGVFLLGGNLYRYLEYRNATNTLINVRVLPGGALVGAHFTDGAAATTVATAQVTSTGQFPGPASPLNVSRAVTYWWPLSGTGSGFTGESSFPNLDDNNLDNWSEGRGRSLGTFDRDATAQAIRVTSVQPGSHSVASMMFEPADGSRIEAADYEAQVKIRLAALDPRDYMAGISFRMQTDDHRLASFRGYGVSLLRYDPAAAPPSSLKRLPTELIPAGIGDTPIIVLWRADNGLNRPLTRLAWAPVSVPGSRIVDNQGHLREWTTLLLRVEEMGTPGARYNRITVMFGDHAENSTTGNTNPFDHARISSRRLVSQPPPAKLPWPSSDFGRWTPSRDHFTVIEWNEATGFGATRHTYSGRPIYIHTATNEFLYRPAGIIEVGLHAFGENLENKVWFDDFDVRVANTGGGIGQFVPPIQM